MTTPVRLTPFLLAFAVAACGRSGLLPRTLPSPAEAVASAGPAVAGVPAEFDGETSPADDTGPSDDAPVEPAAPSADVPPPAWDIDVAPYESHERVEYFVQRFSGAMRPTFEIALERQSRYAPMIHEKLRAGGLPEDMIFLPLIESWYDPHAYSAAAAVGMWQFMTRTAKGVGLRVDWWVDQRRDPVAATDGAVRYLNQLHDNFGSIYLASAAYNGGPGRISRGLESNAAALEGAAGDELFFALSDNTKALRAETRDYVPKLIAAALVGKDPLRYGVEVRRIEPFTWDSVVVAANTPLAAVAKALQVPLDTLRDYNPQILRGMTPPSGEALWLRVPLGSPEGYTEAFAALPEAERAATKRVVTREGDYITKIARANGLTARELNWYNPQATRLSNGNLHAGQRILVPRRDVVAAARDVPNPSIERYGASSSYVVRRGDNLSIIARKHGTTIARLRQLNRLRSDVIRPGQRLRTR